jgi:hypothetical protein
VAGSNRVRPEELGLRDLPKAWRGATVEQLLRSAEKVVEQSQAVGGSQDPRLAPALKILKLKEQLKAQRE